MDQRTIGTAVDPAGASVASNRLAESPKSWNISRVARVMSVSPRRATSRAFARAIARPSSIPPDVVRALERSSARSSLGPVYEARVAATTATAPAPGRPRSFSAKQSPRPAGPYWV